MNIENAHPYIIAAAHSFLAEQNKNRNLIESTLVEWYHQDIEFFTHLENEEDYGYLLQTNSKLILAISGTKSKVGWIRNFKIFNPQNGMHRGFNESFLNLFYEPLCDRLKKFNGKVFSYGHSAGDAESKIAAYYLRRMGMGQEQIGFCGPTVVMEDGFKAFKQQHVCSTRIYVGKQDQVDNIHDLFMAILPMKAKHYGYPVKLPDIGDPEISKIELLDDFFYGHAPTYVCKCMKKMFMNWGRLDQIPFLEEVMGVAIK